jgi:hypothetical protein
MTNKEEIERANFDINSHANNLVRAAKCRFWFKYLTRKNINVKISTDLKIEEIIDENIEPVQGPSL